MIGAFVPLASFALFHLVTIFPLSWITLFTRPARSREFLLVQIVGARGRRRRDRRLRPDRRPDRPPHTLGSRRAMIAVFSGIVAPLLLGGGVAGQTIFIIIGFGLLGLSYGQAAGAVTSNFATQLPLHRRGADLRPGLADRRRLRAAGGARLSSRFGLACVSVYLLSGAVCTLVALSLDRRLESRYG